MAYFFTIKNSTETVTLNSQGRGTVQCTVRNVSAAPIDGHAVLASLPNTPPANDPVAKGWVKIDGKPNRHFEKDQEEVYSVTINVPLTPENPPPRGKYSFLLQHISDQRPDMGDFGVAITFEVPKVEKEKGLAGWQVALIILAIVVVVGGGGYGVYYAITHGGASVPNLHGMSVADATKKLAEEKLTIDTANIEIVQSTPEDSDKIVDQTPKANERLKQSVAVRVKVGAQMVPVISVLTQTVEAAQHNLSLANLSTGVVTIQNNDAYGPGVVWQQNPASGAALTGSPVALTATPKTVQVPPVATLSVGAAIQLLQSKGLDVGSIIGDQVTQPVKDQSPAAYSQQPIGTKVNLIVPSSDVCRRINCKTINIWAVRMLTQPTATRVPGPQD